MARVGVHDGFFDVGGHSIRALALTGALRAAGFDVAVRDIFEHRTVAELTAELTGRAGLAGCDAGVAPFELISAEDRAALPDDVVDAYPLSQVQVGMLVEILAGTDPGVYHNVASFRVLDEQPFDEDALRAAARLAVEQHDMLRTSFDLDRYEVPMQLVHADAEIPIVVRHRRGLDRAAFMALVREFTHAELALPFDIATAPLLRLVAHVASDQEWWLTVTVSHPIAEGWSHNAMLMDLLVQYRRIRAGWEPEPATRPEVRYADFIAAELRALDSDADRGYWRRVVTDRPAFTLPTGWGADPAERRTVYTVPVPLADLMPGLTGLAGATRTSLKSVLLAAHLKVLSQLTDEPDFHSGLVFSARPEIEGADRLYGMFLNTLPIAFDRGARTWRELVGAVHAREAEMWPHRRFPMPVIQQELHGGERLLDARFSFQGFDQVDTDLVDTAGGVGDGVTEFPLAVAAVSGKLLLTTNTHVISQANADRLVAMYRAVLASMAADPDAEAATVLLPPGERKWLLSAAGEPDAGRTVLESVLEAFERQAAETPDAIALDRGETTLSYAELDALANRYANHLAGLGAGPESVVAVLLDRGPDLVASFLGIWKAGAAYLPLDPSFPPERVAGMLADAGVRTVLTDSAYADRFAGAAPDHLSLVDRNPPHGHPATSPGVPADPDRLAYVIFTSGSTGRPKGVQITHRGLANHVRWAAGELAGRGSRGAAVFSSVAFDLVVPNLWAPLVTGQRVCLLPQDLDPAELGAALAAAGPFSFLKLTPGHLDMLVHQLTAEELAGLAGAVVVAGEAFTGDLADLAVEQFGPGVLINEYGPTEASVGTCTHPVDRTGNAATVPIGQSLPGMRMYVLDERMYPVPVGVRGELYVGGVGVARGYLGQPGLTAGRFVPDPFGPAGNRLYRTGDVVRMLPSGAVDFLGRRDGQVKIRGYRIELDELRAVLLTHPGVRAAVVIAREDRPGDRQLVAYCVPRGGDLAARTELAAHCRTFLPDYMVPAHFVSLPEIPLTANGKLDVAALPATARESGEDSHEPPVTETERQLAAIWAEALDVPTVGRRDRFFDLGGHSILMIRVLAAARQAGLAMSLAMMYQHETLAELAGALDEQPAEDRPAPGARADQEPVTGDVVLTPIQRRFLTLDGARERHVQAARLVVSGPVDVAALNTALRALVMHHDALRLRVTRDGETWSARITADPAPDRLVRVVDLDGMRLLDQVREMDRVAARTAASHELGEGNLLRAVLFRRGTDVSAQLLVSIHHLAVDIVSWPILVADLNTAYQQVVDGAEIALPARTTSFRDWARRLAEYAGSAELAAEAPYWLNWVAGNPLPVDRPDGANTNRTARTITAALPAELTEAMTHRLPAAGVRADEAFLAALGSAVTRWAGGDRLSVDLEGHGREDLFDDVDVSRTVGWFTSLFPVSLWFPRKREPGTVLRTVCDQLRSVPGKGIGYGLLRYLAPDEDLSDALAERPAPQIIVNYSGHGSLGGRPAAQRPRFALPPRNLGGGHDPDRPRAHLFEINANVHDGRLHVHWTYPGERYDDATVRRLAQDQLAALTAMIEAATTGHEDGAGPGRPRTAAAAVAPLPDPAEAMAEHGVPGVAVAVIRDGRLAAVHGYGTLTAGGAEAVTLDTLFQVGSISKHLAAIGALRLVDQGRLDLDRDVNDYLESWRLPGGDTVPGTVTTRGLLGQVAGLSIGHHGGCRPGEPVPTLLDLLTARPPAPRPPVTMELVPGERFRKSNAHFWVLEQLMRDITGEPFDALMRRLVLDPLGMTGTSYDQAFPVRSGLPVALGHDERGTPVPGGWLVKPAMASTGMWSTAADLATVTVELRRAYRGEPGALLPAPLVEQLLTIAHPDCLYGLGTSVDRTEHDVEFGHVGESVGYRAMSIGRMRGGAGFVVLTNSESGKEVHKFVAIGLGRQDGQQFGRGHAATY